MASISIREARDPADFRRFHALQRAYEAELPADLRHPLADAAQVRQHYAKPHAAFLAFAERTAAGCVATRRLDPATDVLQRLYVAPALRGMGVARRLVTAAIATARNAGCLRVVLDTDRERLSAAYALYASLGFSECAPYAPASYASPTYMELSIR